MDSSSPLQETAQFPFLEGPVGPLSPLMSSGSPSIMARSAFAMSLGTPLNERDFALRLSEVHCRKGELREASELLKNSLQNLEAPMTYLALVQVYLELGEHARAFQACTHEQTR